MSDEYLEEWHEVQDIEKILHTSKKTGLSAEEVEKRFEKWGINEITKKKTISPFMLFLSQFNQSLVLILIIAGLVTFFLNKVVDSIFIFLVVIINAIVGFIQEYKAIKAVDSLSKHLQGHAHVIRGEEVHQIPMSELTIGDLVILEAGSKVPADVRLIQSSDLHVNESMLTGESLPISKITEELPRETSLADRRNMAYFGTNVTSGSGKGFVVEIGDNTQMGKINQLIAKADILDTPLTKRIHQFSQLLLFIIIAVTIGIFTLGAIRGEDLLTMFLLSVALAVAVIPAGVPAAVTITLAIGVSRMAKRNAIITKLPAVETLGSTQIICSDKTGTLTQNKMTVQRVFTQEGEFEILGSGYDVEGQIKGPIKFNKSKEFMECIKAGVLCNDSHLELNEETKKYDIIGDPTEGSLLISAKKAGIEHEDEVYNDERVDSIPFESKYKYMATLHQSGVVYVKGAAEIILEMSNLNSNTKKKYKKIYENYANQGLRVLGFAKLHSKKKKIHRNDLKELTFLGFQAMIDPPRDEVIHSIKNCYTAQIGVKMITGDHILTALAIAKKIGIKHTNDALSGAQIKDMSDGKLSEVIERVNVFARVSPEDKIRLVRILQNKNYVVAMTGDGVNDAPSLKQANVGVAMGITGTDVTKESADMILLDDNFSTIERAVQEGRGVYDNLVKFLTWTLPTNVGEGLIIILSVIIGGILPIEPLQLLWINMTTAILLGLMLAFEPKEEGIMRRPPHDSNNSFLTPNLIQRILMVGVMLSTFAYFLFNLTLSAGYSVEMARTVAINMFIFGELIYLFNCRNLIQPIWKLNFWSNMYVIYGSLVMIILQLLFTYTNLMNSIFSSAPITLWGWFLIVSCSLAIFVVIEFEKIVRLHNNSKV